MEFIPTDAQDQLRHATRELLVGECSPEVVRRAWDDDGFAREVWQHLARAGLTALTAPEDLGGSGGSTVDLVLVLEECGWAAAPVPVLETTAVAMDLLASVEWSDAADWIAAVASGSGVVATGLMSGGLIDFAGHADLLLLADGGRIHAIDPRRVRRTAQPSVDGARQAQRVEWGPADGTVVAEGPAAEAAVAHAHDVGALGAAAMLLGIGQRAIELAVAYAGEREQFDRPIGSFQAVKHRLADAVLDIEVARPLVHRAALTVAADGPHRPRDVSMAKAFASDAAVGATRAALQVHGAIGYTWEHDLHLWIKQAASLSRRWGDARWHRARVGRHIF